MKKLLTVLLILLCSSIEVSANNYTYTNPGENNVDSIPKSEKNYSEQILFIVDFSNSMNEKMGYKTKLEVALETIKETLQMIPDTTYVGLRVYGHKTGFTPKQSCTASELVAPIQKNNITNIYNRLDSIKAVGWTPITYSLKQAAFFDFENADAPKRIILLSDGGENCNESPCDFIIELMKYRDDIKIDVIALAVGDQEANNQLKCVALVTSGKFYNANSASDLKNSLQDTLKLHKEVQGMIISK